MNIYTEKNKEADSVEIALSYQELSNLTDSLMQFKDKVKRFKLQHKGKENLGYTHLHLQDCDWLDKNSKIDMVFYVDLNEE